MFMRDCHNRLKPIFSNELLEEIFQFIDNWVRQLFFCQSLGDSQARHSRGGSAEYNAPLMAM